ncbi:flavin-containing monooxygenase [Saccharothrix yanglingensis]|uniref:4-hydroxyacetophenone monooxygenase n=1 Tax=Saccharothrix yanglingensis TaxID=659496 RepID=A0ABU0WVW7_9PSEU|nr:NAD(P)/FAD-dependent oxidoreductase [Saccharothrix yanglingensis]MDQ2584011.1 4-hydroxyacetophenone monooxygenase [Saccharothrix yanglingensis]
MRVVVVGAGFSGIGMALALRRAGVGDVVVLERADDVGGVWRDNTYPGAACDVPSSLYSFSFARQRSWPRRYARQPDILAHLRRLAAPVRDLVRTGCEVAGASHGPGGWRVRLVDGSVVEADVLISAVGQLSRPAVPDLPGRFGGPAFHSARWRHDVDLAGRRVAVIGTGASAVQFVPHLRRVAARVVVFQRTAPHVLPKPDAVTRSAPLLGGRVGRLGTWVAGEALTFALTRGPWSRSVVEAATALHRFRRVRDPVLRARLAPGTPAGCRRLLFSNDWYPALTSPDVDVVTERVTGLVEGGVRTADGVVHEADVLVYGTGFAATDFLAPMEVRGAGGRLLSDEWAGGARAHLGITVPGFPNLFLLYGPNTNLGGNSVLTMVEAQIRYVVRVLRHFGGRPVEVRREVAEAFDAEVQRRLRHSVWTLCRNWYRDGERVTTNWPGQVAEYRLRTARADLADLRPVGG